VNALPSLAPVAWVGLLACLLGVAALVHLVVGPRPQVLPLHRRRPNAPAAPGALSTATAATSSMIDQALRRRNRAETYAARLEQAGLRLRPQDFVLLVAAAALVAGAAGLVVGGPVLGLVLGALTPLGARVLLNLRTTRRRKAFADQLEDSLQLLASSLRAGHSLLQALNSVSHEAEEPTSVEFARIINEIRVGRQVGQALDEAALRMESEDFVWVIQAIAINREVGGNLAEVLDGVGHTIRERGAIRRQVQALSAEGKLSALVLMLLPVGIVGFLSLTNPGYLLKLTHNVIGYGLIGLAGVLMLVGALWLRKVVSFKF
jgi:tight adherence protein B